MAVVGFLVIRISGDNPVVVIVMFFFILMGGQVFTNGQLPALLSQAIDYGEWKNGVRGDGTVTCASNVGIKVGGALGTAVMGLLLGAFGFVEGGVEQTASAVTGIKMVYTVGTPVIYAVLVIVFLTTWGLTKIFPTVSKELTERRIAAGAKLD